MEAISDAGTRVERVMAYVTRQLAARSLTTGAKLPSLRRMARTMAVSTSTVVEAYDRLVAEGAIRSRPGSGFFVAAQTAPLSLAAVGPKVDRAIDPFWISRQSLESGDEEPKPGCGWLPPSWLPGELISKSLRTLSRADGSSLTGYGSPLGMPPLRKLVARRLADKGVEVSPDQIILTESGTQAIDLLCRFFIESGDTVIVDDPCYFNFQALLRAHRVKIVGVPYTPADPDIDAFRQALVEHRPRLYITNSAIQNPTGATLSPVIAHKVLKLADQHGLIIVEDDIFADFEHHAAPRLAAFDGLDRVIQIGSFSKTLSASVRCGFIAARAGWIDGLTDLKIATSFGGGRFNAELIFGMLGDGGYRKHMERLRNRLARARSEIAARLADIGIRPWILPDAGIFLWCRLPDGLDAADVARAALGENIVLAPGNAFSVSQSAANHMRFNVSQMHDARIFEVLQRSIESAAKGK